MELSEFGCGTISAFGSEKDRNNNPTKCTIAPLMQEGVVTPEFSIQYWLRGNMGKLEVGTKVVYIQFPDGSGTVIARADGNWDGILPDELLTEKGVTVTKDVLIKGNFKVEGDSTLIGKTLIDGSLEITKKTPSGSFALGSCPGGQCPVSGITTGVNKTV